MTFSYNNEGSMIIDDVIDGHLFTRVYQGYSKREAIKLFKQECKSQNYWTLKNLPLA